MSLEIEDNPLVLASNVYASTEDNVDAQNYFMESITETQKRGHGFWKFNNSLLKDINTIKSIISNAKAEI